jgi:phospholipase C
MLQRRNLLLLAASAALVIAGVTAGTAAADPSSWRGHGGRTPTINGFKNVVVIYEENHSFDSLCGTLGPGERAAGHRAGRCQAGQYHPDHAGP